MTQPKDTLPCPEPQPESTHNGLAKATAAFEGPELLGPDGQPSRLATLQGPETAACVPHGLGNCPDCSLAAAKVELGMCEEHGRRDCRECAKKEPPIDWQWRDLASFADFAAPTSVVSGLLIEGGLSLFFGPVKSGKSTLTMALLKALSPGGPEFCGLRLVPTSALVFSEQPPSVMGAHVREFGIPAGAHMANEAGAISRPAADFANDVYKAYHENGAGFGLVVIDTLASFMNIQEVNSYGEVSSIMAPLRQLLVQIPNLAILMLHHLNKAGSEGWAGALGSTAMTAQSDQLIRLGLKDGKRSLTVGGRYPTAPFPYDEPMTVSITPAGVEIIGNAADDCADAVLAVFQTLTEPAKISAIVAKVGDGHSVGSVRLAIRALLNQGDIVEVDKARGNVAATYQIAG